MAIKWMVRLVEPPVAHRPTIPLTKARASSNRPIGRTILPRTGNGDGPGHGGAGSEHPATACRAPRKADPGSISPMISISIWLVLAVPKKVQVPGE